jgi:hypothetical protein
MSDLDVTPGVPSEPTADRVAELTGQPRSWVDGMLFDRRGERHDSNMTAIGLHCVVRASEAYLVSAERGVVIVDDQSDVRELEAMVQARSTTPRLHTRSSPPRGAMPLCRQT